METFSRLLAYAKERKMFMVLSLIFSAIATILSFVPYYYFWRLLREITSQARFVQIQEMSYIIFGTTLLYSMTYLLSLMFSHLFAFRLETNMRKKGLIHLLEASFSFFDVNPSGRTRKIIDDNSSNTHSVVAHMLPDMINAILFPICLLILAFVVNIYVGILIVLAILFSSICFKSMYANPNMMQEYMSALEDINSETVEYVRGIQVVKIFDTVIKSFERLYKSIMHYSNIVNEQCQAYKIPFITFQCGMMSFGALIILVAFRDLSLSRPVGEVLSLVVFFITFSGLLYGAFMKIMFFNKNFELGKDAIDKLEGLFSEMDQNKLTTGTVSGMEKYDISFENVTFKYENVEVLKDFNLHLPAHRKYALIGSSGSGKSTIAKLISGFYPVLQGQIKIGDHALTDYTSETLEKNIAFVFQHAKLFKTSIYENVKVGKPDSSYEEIMQALKLAMCDSILDKFETRENTVIGAQGVHLSGGETQRIALARAILKDAPIVILDEASAASDPENEYEMQRAFSSLMADKTVIMIAHRLSSIRDVDEILVIDDGKVVERGDHLTLMAENNQYRHFQELYNQANEWRVSS